MRDAHFDALAALVNAQTQALATPRTAGDPSKVSTSGAREYVQLILTRRFGGNPRNAGLLSPSGWRVTARAVCLSENNARIVLDAVNAGLEDHTVTVGSVVSTPIAFEAEDGVRQDDDDKNIWSGLTSFTYAF